MKKDLKKICRVCMSNGSRSIFQNTLNVGHEIPMQENVSSPDRLLEKLRYVSMVKITENDNLPYLLCDLCIIQLNVAYNFKRLAVDTDSKLRQYVIENGLTCDSQNSPASSASLPLISKSTTTVVTQMPTTFIHRPFISVPVQIKTEPLDYEVMSDITIDTNTEADDGTFNNRNYGTPSQMLNDNSTPSPQSMVKVNNNNLLTATSSDSEFIKNYFRPPSSLGYSSSAEPLCSGNSLKPISEPTLIVANVKSINKPNETVESTTATATSTKTKDSSTGDKSKCFNKVSSRELRGMYKIDFNFKPADRSNSKLRKVNSEKPLNYKTTKSLKRRVLNPANRLQKEIKQEMVKDSASNSPVNLLSTLTTNYVSTDKSKPKSDTTEIKSNKTDSKSDRTDLRSNTKETKSNTKEIKSITKDTKPDTRDAKSITKATKSVTKDKKSVAKDTKSIAKEFDKSSKKTIKTKRLAINGVIPTKRLVNSEFGSRQNIRPITKDIVRKTVSLSNDDLFSFSELTPVNSVLTKKLNMKMKI